MTATIEMPRSPLLACALETEHHVASAGWDQPMRLFALVRTSSLLEAQPHLRESLEETDADALSAIEQEGLPTTSSIEELLGPLAWPEEVDGVALSVERVVVPPEAEKDLPEDPDEAARVLLAHPDAVEVRIVVAVLRDGEQVTLLRQRSQDTDDRVAVGDDIAPGLVEALRMTLLPD